MVAFSFLPSKHIQTENLSSSTPSRNNSTTTSKSVASSEASQKQQNIQNIKVSEPLNTISVSIAVRQATSTLRVPEGSSVYEAMNILASTTSFSFHGTYYSGMGYYIDEINGEKNHSNAFWIYYVNGAQANIGASSYILKNGDTIRWRLEDSAKKEVNI